LEVFDINGRLIEILANEYLSEGNYYIDWYGTNNYNKEFKGGVYTIRLSNNNTIETIKLIMLK
jgi:flagellar hook assembly protein FlgD